VFGTTQRQAWEWSVEALREIAKSAASVGVRLVIEPTSFDSNLVDRCDDAIMLMDDAGEANVKLMFDTFHVLYRREVCSDYVYKMGKNLAHLHISDERRLPPGQGRGDFVSVVKALKDINYDGYLAMELGFDRRDIEPDLVARQALEYLKPLVDQANAGKTISLR
jgi:sugar phosphate isomerase/epimerase